MKKYSLNQSNSHNYHLSNFLAGVVTAQKKKMTEFSYTPSTSFLITNVAFLVKSGYFFYYTLSTLNSNQEQITVGLKYLENGNPLVQSIHFYSKPSYFSFCTYKLLLKKVRQDKSLFIVSTSQYGINSHFSCLQNKIGGILLYSIK